MAQPAPRSVSQGADLSGRRLGRYEVLTQLASGGMATVYVARAQGVAGFERLVAVKVLHPHLAHDEDFISMFLDEARLAARIRHPNVVGTLDISDSEGDGYFLVMEYVEGDHFGAFLRNAAKEGERLPAPVVARILMDALTGLHAAHTLTDSSGELLDLVHRDVSPHNILVGGDGVARITDFGVAKAQVRLSSTRDGQFKGKLSYMAPEQAASGEADQRSDLFSMGIVLWEALTGRRLFRGENNAEVLNKILNADVPPLSSFDPILAPYDIVAQHALAKNPSERFQTADAFIEAIEAAAEEVGGVATPRAVAREVKRWLGEKVARERQTIIDSMDALGRSEFKPGILPRPMESGSQPSMPFGSAPVDPAEMTIGAKPSRMSSRPEAPKRSMVLPILGALVVLLFLGGGAVAAYLWLVPQEAVVVPGPGPEPVPVPVVGATDTVGAGTVEAGTVEAGTVEAGTVEAAGTDVAGTDVTDVAGTEPANDDPAGTEPAPEGTGSRGRSRRSRRGGGTRVDPEDDDGILGNPYRR